MRFSQRYGHQPVKDALQLDGMDEDLRVSLWNALELCYWGLLENEWRYGQDNLVTHLWMNFFKYPIDTIPRSNSDGVRQHVRRFLFEHEWYKVYDLMEFVARDLDASFRMVVNNFLETEASGYRFVNGCITQIIDETEIEAIETAVAGENKPVSEQLSRALEFLSDRHNPDYRNSIKESISAVEGQIRSTLGTDNGTLGALLNNLNQQAPMHPALKDAFSKLYGYTSDESGIRHALIDDGREIKFEEAKFMLVACSAFINYVRGVSAP